MKRLVFATNNAHKLHEARAIAAGRLEVLSLADIGCHDDIPETATTLRGNALLKARHVSSCYHVACFADDTGLLVDALHGAPGVLTARYAGEQCSADDNTALLLANLEGHADRHARFVTEIAYIDADGRERFFTGEVDGDITTGRRGAQGFGYDPVFAPREAGGPTFAEMGEEGKNAISHRGRAISAMLDDIFND